eukprot:3672374-Amphidinium_carterae.2
MAVITRQLELPCIVEPYARQRALGQARQCLNMTGASPCVRASVPTTPCSRSWWRGSLNYV